MVLHIPNSFPGDMSSYSLFLQSLCLPVINKNTGVSKIIQFGKKFLYIQDREFGAFRTFGCQLLLVADIIATGKNCGSCNPKYLENIVLLISFYTDITQTTCAYLVKMGYTDRLSFL